MRLLLLLVLPAVQAADCTSAQIAELSALQSNVTAVCGSDALSSTTAVCSDSNCLAYVTGLLDSVPSCEVSSYNLRSVLTTAVNSCDADSDAVPAEKSAASALQTGALLAATAAAISLLI